MELFVAARAGGKTTRIIHELLADPQSVVVVATAWGAEAITNQLLHFGMHHSEVKRRVVGPGERRPPMFPARILVDDLDAVLRAGYKGPIHFATISATLSGPPTPLEWPDPAPLLELRDRLSAS